MKLKVDFAENEKTIAVGFSENGSVIEADFGEIQTVVTDGMNVTDDGDGNVSVGGVVSVCTANHSLLENRNLPDQHTIESITGLAEALENAGGGIMFETDETLTLKNGVLSVNTADSVEPDNTLPITSAAVATQVGNIEIILSTI